MWLWVWRWRRLAPEGGVKRAAVFAGLALTPDLDVVAFVFHVPYEASWGHRGATHALFFATVLSGLVAGMWPLLAGGRVRTFALCLVALASHGLLDAMTTGGLGAALYWPFSEERVFFAWRLLPVAPIGLKILSPRGLLLMAHEALLFLPAWVVAFVPRSRPRARK